jgi:uroporphyrinogen decarboxylase
MTKRERVIQALRHKETDIVPYNITFTQPMAEKMTALLECADLGRAFNNHFCTFTLWRFTEVQNDIFQDEAGVLWDKSKDKDIGVVCNRLIPVLEDRDFKLPGLDKTFMRSGLSWLKENKQDAFGLFDIGMTLYERSWTLRGVENLLMDMIDSPGALHALLDEITAYLHEALDMALDCDFVDGVLFGDDWGTQRGLIMGTDRWREFFKPRFKSLYEKVKSRGKFVLQHSCGHIEDIFGDLIDIGLDCYQTFQPEVYNIEKIKAAYGRDLAFWGGISTQSLLPFGTPERVAEETARTLRIMGKDGGYIAAPAHDVPGDVPVENLMSMWNALKNQQ